jgi:hypothetical protein
MYLRFLVLAIAAGCALAASNAVAAPERVRGTISGVSGDTLTVDTAAAAPHFDSTDSGHLSGLRK